MDVYLVKAEGALFNTATGRDEYLIVRREGHPPGLETAAARHFRIGKCERTTSCPS